MPRPTSRRKKRKPRVTGEEAAKVAGAGVGGPVPVAAAAGDEEAEAVPVVVAKRPKGRSSPEKVHAASVGRAGGKGVAVAVQAVAEAAEAVRVVAEAAAAVRVVAEAAAPEVLLRRDSVATFWYSPVQLIRLYASVFAVAF